MPTKLLNWVFPDGEVIARRTRNMKLRTVTIRLIALVVLFASFSDYWAYDRWDPTAPMNATGPEAVAALTQHIPSNVCWRRTDLTDDYCVFCAPLVSPPAPVLPQPSLGALLENEQEAGLVAGPSRRLATFHPPPIREATGFDRPHRV